MAATAKYNRSNPAVKRILQEVKEMQSNPSPEFMALPLEVPISTTSLTLSSGLSRSDLIQP
jgi:ubiquitin-protein ligase